MNLEKGFPINDAAAVSRSIRCTRELAEAWALTLLVANFAGITAVVVGADPRTNGRNYQVEKSMQYPVRILERWYKPVLLE